MKDAVNDPKFSPVDFVVHTGKTTHSSRASVGVHLMDLVQIFYDFLFAKSASLGSSTSVSCPHRTEAPVYGEFARCNEIYRSS